MGTNRRGEGIFKNDGKRAAAIIRGGRLGTGHRIGAEQREVGGHIGPDRGLVIGKGERLGFFGSVAASVRDPPFFDQGVVESAGPWEGILGKDQFRARVTIVEYHGLCRDGLLPAQKGLILRDTEQLGLFIVGDRNDLLMLLGIPAVVFGHPGTGDRIGAATVWTGSFRKGNLWIWVAIIGGDQRRRIGDIFAGDAHTRRRVAERRGFCIADSEDLGCRNRITTSIPRRPGAGDRPVTGACSCCGQLGKRKKGFGVAVVGNRNNRSCGYCGAAQRRIRRDTYHHRGGLILDGYRLGAAGGVATSIFTCPGAHQGETRRTSAGDGILPIRKEGAGVTVVAQGQRCSRGYLIAAHRFIRGKG